jgi:Ferritin-like domain
MQDLMLETPVDVLNYALTLEHLEHAFYRDGLEEFTADDFTAAGYSANVYDYFGMIRDHEQEHVDTIMKVITDLGGEPVAEAEYDFGYSDLAGFVGVAQVLENTGVSAYQGAAQFLIDEDELLTAALTIHGVEARHAAYLNGLQGESPFPDAVNPTLTPDEVLAAAGPFIVS